MVDGKLERAVYCPRCGYDLRGMVEGRCSECGALVRAGGGVRSAIPWVGRRFRGRWRGYWQTVWLVAWRPGELAKEVGGRVALRDARRFHRVSMGVAMVIGVLLVGGTFLLRGDQWAKYLNEQFRLNGYGPEIGSDLVTLMQFVLTDSLLILLPAAMSLWVGFALTMGLYRRVFMWGCRDALRRRRGFRLAYYGSGVLPMVIGALGAASMAAMVAYDHEMWVGGGWGPTVLWILSAILCVGAWMGFVLPASVVMREAMGAGLLKRVLFAVFFPWGILVLWFPLTGVVFAVVGYGVVAVWSAIH